MAFSAKERIFSRIPTKLAFFLERMREMGTERNIPNISWNTASFLMEKLQSREVFHILEIGPANGFSTMMLALACPKAQITSIECSRHAFEELRHNISAFSELLNTQSERIFSPAQFGPKVTSSLNQVEIEQFSLYFADARDILPAFLSGASEILCSNPKSLIQDISKQEFDFIFIDGAFRMTREFFDLSQPLLAKNGLIILDDAIKYRWKMEGFHEYLEDSAIPYELIQTDEDDGVMVMDFGNNSSLSA